MTPIKATFKYGGFVFSQILREGNFAIYQKKRQGRTHYEVIHILRQKASEFNGIKFEEREKYPCNEDFGSKAWCYSDYEEAKKKFDGLLLL
jgi:hypothetical protein